MTPMIEFEAIDRKNAQLTRGKCAPESLAAVLLIHYRDCIVHVFTAP